MAVKIHITIPPTSGKIPKRIIIIRFVDNGYLSAGSVITINALANTKRPKRLSIIPIINRAYFIDYETFPI